MIRTEGSVVIVLVLLASILAAISPYIASPKAQNQATVVVIASVGGTTDPSPGNYNYPDGASVTFTATPDETNGYLFAFWAVSTDTGNSSTNTGSSFTLTVTGGVTYQVSAIFNLPNTEPIPPVTSIPANASAIVTILHAVGGHTTPAEGTFYLTNQSQLVLTAVPDTNWTFSHWIITGSNIGHGGSPFTSTPTDNPLTLTHGFGYSYAFQPVFNPPSNNTGGTGGTGGNTSTGGISTETVIIAGLIIVIVVILIVFGVYAYSKRNRK